MPGCATASAPASAGSSLNAPDCASVVPMLRDSPGSSVHAFGGSADTHAGRALCADAAPAPATNSDAPTAAATILIALMAPPSPVARRSARDTAPALARRGNTWWTPPPRAARAPR